MQQADTTLLDVLQSVREAREKEGSLSNRFFYMQETVRSLKTREEAHDGHPFRLWYYSPLSLWTERTYGIFMSSFLQTFYNLQIHFEGEDESDSLFTQLTEEMATIMDQLHRTDPVVSGFMDALWKERESLLAPSKSGMDGLWRDCPRVEVAQLVCSIWRYTIQRCGKFAQTNPDDLKRILSNSLLNELATIFTLPTVLAEMVMQYITIKFTYFASENAQEQKARSALARSLDRLCSHVTEESPPCGDCKRRFCDECLIQHLTPCTGCVKANGCFHNADDDAFYCSRCLLKKRLPTQLLTQMEPTVPETQ